MAGVFGFNRVKISYCKKNRCLFNVCYSIVASLRGRGTEFPFLPHPRIKKKLLYFGKNRLFGYNIYVVMLKCKRAKQRLLNYL